MPLTPYMTKNVIDWITGAAAATQPAARWLSFATGSPDTANASDGAFTGQRRTVTFASGNSPQGSKTNLNAIVGGSASGLAQSVRGWNIWDASTSGNRIAFGTVTAILGCRTSDNPQIGAGLLKITLT